MAPKTGVREPFPRATIVFAKGISAKWFSDPGFRNYRKVRRVEALDSENTRHAQRELHWYVDDDGYWVIRGRLTAEQGALVQTVL